MSVVNGDTHVRIDRIMKIMIQMMNSDKRYSFNVLMMALVLELPKKARGGTCDVDEDADKDASSYLWVTWS